MGVICRGCLFKASFLLMLWLLVDYCIWIMVVLVVVYRGLLAFMCWFWCYFGLRSPGSWFWFVLGGLR